MQQKDPEVTEESGLLLQSPGDALVVVTRRMSGANRMMSLDMLRGFIMVLMAWDHCKDELADDSEPLNHGELTWSAPFATYDDRADLFLARFVSDFCAPGFFWTMGVGMIFFAESRRERGWKGREIARHFAVRALFLFFIGRLVNISYAPITALSTVFPDNMSRKFSKIGATWAFPFVGVFEVLTCLSLTMLFVGCVLPLFCSLRSYVLQLPPSGSYKGMIPLSAAHILFWFLGIMSFVISEIVVKNAQGTNPDAAIPFPMFGAEATYFSDYLVRILALPGIFQEGVYMYPFIPWVGLSLIGVSCGTLFRRRHRLAHLCALIAGLVSFAMFLWIRYVGSWGNLRDGGASQGVSKSIAFFNLCKYPPSVAYALVTMGPVLVALAGFQKAAEMELRIFKPFLILGRAPLFFYLIHWWLLAIANVLLRCVRNGLPLVWVVPVWITVILIMLPLCYKYDGFKSKKPSDSLWRLL